MKPFPCPHCGKRFVDDYSRWQHAKVVHPGKSMKNATRAPRPEREESIADLVVQAQIDRAMGLPVDDWIEDMLP